MEKDQPLTERFVFKTPLEPGDISFIEALSSQIHEWKSTGRNLFSYGERARITMIYERIAQKKSNPTCGACLGRSINAVIHWYEEYKRHEDTNNS